MVREDYQVHPVLMVLVYLAGKGREANRADQVFQVLEASRELKDRQVISNFAILLAAIVFTVALRKDHDTARIT